MRASHLTLLSFVLAASKLASGGPPSAIAQPALGYSFDSAAAAIRPIWGIPGAALPSDPLSLNVPLASAAVYDQLGIALVVSGADQSVQLAVLNASPATLSPLNGAMTAPDRMVFSASGTAAALYSVANSHLQVVTGLPGSPVVSEVPAANLRNPLALAVSDDGSHLLAAYGTTDSDPVWLLSADGAAVQLPLSGTTAALAFDAGRQNAAFVTLSGDVILASGLYGQASYTVIQPGGDATSAPVAVRFSAAGDRVFVATQSGALAVISASAGLLSRASCQCAPTGLIPSASQSLFRLNEVSGNPVLLFDATSPDTRVWFVPPPQTPAVPQGSAQ